jgi:hypothetical protein
MADAGFAAQDAGAFRPRDRGRSAEKGRQCSPEHGCGRNPSHKFVCCRTFGMMALERSEGGRVPSRRFT